MCKDCRCEIDDEFIEKYETLLKLAKENKLKISGAICAWKELFDSGITPESYIEDVINAQNLRNSQMNK